MKRYVRFVKQSVISSLIVVAMATPLASWGSVKAATVFDDNTTVQVDNGSKEIIKSVTMDGELLVEIEAAMKSVGFNSIKLNGKVEFTKQGEAVVKVDLVNGTVTNGTVSEDAAVIGNQCYVSIPTIQQMSGAYIYVDGKNIKFTTDVNKLSIKAGDVEVETHNFYNIDGKLYVPQDVVSKLLNTYKITFKTTTAEFVRLDNSQLVTVNTNPKYSCVNFSQILTDLNLTYTVKGNLITINLKNAPAVVQTVTATALDPNDIYFADGKLDLNKSARVQAEKNKVKDYSRPIQAKIIEDPTLIEINDLRVANGLSRVPQDKPDASFRLLKFKLGFGHGNGINNAYICDAIKKQCPELVITNPNLASMIIGGDPETDEYVLYYTEYSASNIQDKVADHPHIIVGERSERFLYVNNEIHNGEIFVGTSAMRLLGYDYCYDPDTNQVMVSRAKDTYTFTIGSDTYIHNGVEKKSSPAILAKTGIKTNSRNGDQFSPRYGLVPFKVFQQDLGLLITQNGNSYTVNNYQPKATQAYTKSEIPFGALFEETVYTNKTGNDTGTIGKVYIPSIDNYIYVGESRHSVMAKMGSPDTVSDKSAGNVELLVYNTDKFSVEIMQDRVVNISFWEYSKLSYFNNVLGKSLSLPEQLGGRYTGGLAGIKGWTSDRNSCETTLSITWDVNTNLVIAMGTGSYASWIHNYYVSLAERQ